MSKAYTVLKTDWYEIFMFISNFGHDSRTIWVFHRKNMKIVSIILAQLIRVGDNFLTLCVGTKLSLDLKWLGSDISFFFASRKISAQQFQISMFWSGTDTNEACTCVLFNKVYDRGMTLSCNLFIIIIILHTKRERK